VGVYAYSVRKVALGLKGWKLSQLSED
jgi:hypothetical protein